MLHHLLLVLNLQQLDLTVTGCLKRHPLIATQINVLAHSPLL